MTPGLARLPEASYAAVFGQSLAEPTLVSILEALEAISAVASHEHALEVALDAMSAELGGANVLLAPRSLDLPFVR